MKGVGSVLKNLCWLLVGAVLATVASFLIHIRPATVSEIQQEQGLEQAFTELSRAIQESGEFVQGHLWYGSEREQAEAYRHIVRVLMNSLLEHAIVDPSFPYFFEIGPYTKIGMDNSDQRYLNTNIEGSGVYRVWGNRGSSRRLDFSLYGRDSLSASIATLTTEQLLIGDDGSFELYIGGPRREGNWMPSQPGLLRLLVRQIHSNWAQEAPGQLHIDRVDSNRPPYPLLDRNIMASRLVNATNKFSSEVRRWPEYSRTRLHALLPANTLTPPRDTGRTGGLSGRLMVGGHYDLADDEALIIKAWPTTAAYQGIQLGHHWWESLDYANRQTSLTTDQAVLSSDGAYYFVIAQDDPGVANWLDTEGFQRGVILMRFDGMENPEMSEEQQPSAMHVKLAELAQHLPSDEPQISPAKRRQDIAGRRRHVQRRYGF
jgi:hypothetical protein